MALEVMNMHTEDEESSDGDQPQNAEIDDLPTKARREAEDEIMETPAAP
jgi:hypothetical protein